MLRKHWRSLSGYTKLLCLFFLLTLPLINPWVRGDGVGYYAYIHSLLIDGDLRFENEWRAGNPTFRMARVDANGQVIPSEYTPTGYVGNHWSVGPSILWAPFLILTHLAVLGMNALGASLAADGFSRPYVVTMALATALYAFLGLLLSFKLARSYVGEKWAYLATLGIWFASSLPVYMYFNPSWSHAHSAFSVSLFLWYWHRTRADRTTAQWVLLGLLSGLMLNVYYPNAILLLVPLLEATKSYWKTWQTQRRNSAGMARLVWNHLLYTVVVVLAFLPTIATRQIIYGTPLELGYYGSSAWSFASPKLWLVLFSSNHGLLSWTPILIPAILGLLWLRRHDREFAGYLIAAFLAYYYLIASYASWQGVSSFGNRFFVSLTPVFVLGLAASFGALENWLPRVRSFAIAGALTAVLALWNAGLIFQWGMHLIPPRGPISWRQAAYNQVAVVPVRLAGNLRRYLLERKSLMHQIEQDDAAKLRGQSGK